MNIKLESCLDILIAKDLAKRLGIITMFNTPCCKCVAKCVETMVFDSVLSQECSILL